MAKTDERSRSLVHVRYAAAALEETRSSLHEAVVVARSAGASWAEIAEALDTSRQVAEHEYGSGGPSHQRAGA